MQLINEVKVDSIATITGVTITRIYYGTQRQKKKENTQYQIEDVVKLKSYRFSSKKLYSEF